MTNKTIRIYDFVIPDSGVHAFTRSSTFAVARHTTVSAARQGYRDHSASETHGDAVGFSVAPVCIGEAGTRSRLCEPTVFSIALGAV